MNLSEWIDSFKRGNMNNQTDFIHHNILTLRRYLKLTQREFIKLYLTDEDEKNLISLSKFSIFENNGGKEAEKIVEILCPQLYLAPEVFNMEPDTFAKTIDFFLEKYLKQNEKTEQVPIKQESNIEKLVRTVSEYLTEGILRGDLEPGMRLPSDRDLAEQFQVGRTIIREAMKVLSVLGLIEIKPGQGTFLANGGSNFFIAPLSWSFYMDKQHVNHVLEVRLLLEKHSASLAAQHTDEKAIEALTVIFAKMEEAYQNKDLSAFLNLDLDFHYAIGDCSKNPIIQNLLQTIRKLIHRESKQGMNSIEQMDQIHSEHKAIYQAIIDGNPELAQKEMSSHLLTSSERSRLNQTYHV